MIKENYKLFPTLVTKYDNFLTEEECSDLFLFCKQINITKHNLCLGNSGSTHLQDFNIITEISKEKKFSNIEKRIKTCIIEYEKDFGLAPLKLSNSWFNLQQKGSSLLQHVHANSVLSGALYVNVDENGSSIYFDNPNTIVNYIRISEKTSEFNFEYFYFKPKKRTLFLFPSWLYHGSRGEQNNTVDRLVISFNTSYII